jgi:putative flavoprotein involved in K+ transport
MTTAETRTEPAPASETDLVEEGAAFEKLQARAGSRRRYDVIVIGGGQAGLSVGYHLARAGLRFVILDGSRRIGDAWRTRWDSLRLFTPARFDSLDGMPFPGDPDAFPSKDAFADYLEAYAERFELPVRSGVWVERLQHHTGHYVVTANGEAIEADQVVVAMARYQRPSLPAFASELREDIVQLDSSAYRNPSQLRPGSVLLIGAGNTGADLAMDLCARHQVILAGRNVGELPFRIGGFWGRLLLVRLVLRVLFHRILTLRTPIGRKARAKMIHGGGPRIRVKSVDLDGAGVEQVGTVVGIRDGWPVLEDGRVLEPDNVIWCTGYRAALSFIDLPILDDTGEPRHQGGTVPDTPGLYFVGLHFLYSASSGMIHGVGRDARRIVGHIVERRARLAPERLGRRSPTREAPPHTKRAPAAAGPGSAEAGRLHSAT